MWVLVASLTGACGARSAIPGGGGESSSRDGGRDAGGGPSDSTPRTITLSVDATVAALLACYPVAETCEIVDSEPGYGVLSFPSSAGGVELRRSVWEFDLAEVHVPTAFTLTKATVVVHGSRGEINDVDVSSYYPADLAIDTDDWGRAALRFGQILGTEGIDGVTWSFDGTDFVGRALSAREPLGVRTSLRVETDGGAPTFQTVGFESVHLELAFTENL